MYYNILYIILCIIIYYCILIIYYYRLQYNIDIDPMLFELPTNSITEIFPLIKLSRNSVTIIQGQSLLMKNETFSHIQILTGNNHYVAI